MHAKKWNRLIQSPAQILSLLAVVGCGAAPADLTLGNEGPDPVADPDAEDVGDEVGDEAEPDIGDDQAKADQDGDGYDAEVDCDDQDDRVHPGAAEQCDGIDNDCDGAIDDADDSLELLTATSFWRDGDGDGFGDAAISVQACVAPEGFVGRDDDCDDAAAEVHPDQDETCDGIDNDCDGEIDVDALDGILVYADGDGDGFGSITEQSLACSVEEGFTTEAGDCDDATDRIYPGAPETCDGVDNDCNGLADSDDPALEDGSTFWSDGDGDGYGDASLAILACELPAGAATNALDCDDSSAANFPGNPEVCDGIDNDCDGRIDDADGSLELSSAQTFFEDADGDGAGRPDATVQACDAPVGFVGNDRDCDDGNATVFRGAAEVCDGIDNNCDATIDDADPMLDVSTTSRFFRDSDGDGYGDPSAAVDACEEPTGYVESSADCDDSAVSVHPGAFETCNGIDDDCSPLTSELGTVAFQDNTTGEWTDMTSAATGTMTLDTEGSLEFCGGEWEVQLDIQGDVSIDGFNGATLSGGNAGSIVVITTDGASATFDGITFTDGAGSGSIGAGSGYAGSGGAISCEADARIEINDSSFEGNSAELGGAIASEGCDIDLLEVSFSGNSATDAEAIWMDGGTLRWAGGSVDGSGVESIVIGASATTSAMLHAVAATGADGNGVAVEGYGDLVCSGEPDADDGVASFSSFDAAVQVAPGGSFRSMGCSFDRSTDAVVPESGVAEQYTGATWMDCDDVSCGTLDPAGASGTAVVEGAVTGELGGDDCELVFDVSAVPTATSCPDCTFALEYTRTYDGGSSTLGSCGELAVDSTVVLGFVPDYLGAGEGALMAYEDGAWTQAYTASIMGHYLMWGSLESDVIMGYSDKGEPTPGEVSMGGQAVIY
jgi:predicted outer membrane repeat protein